MSLQMKVAVARRGHRGDPGLFGFLGTVVKTAAGVLPGPAGIIGKAVSGVLPGKNLLQPRSPNVLLPTGSMPTLTLPGGTSSMPGTGLVPAGAMPADMPMDTGAGPSSCKVGFRMNKSKYFTERDIFGVKTGGITIHNPGTKCVKVRRMNPLNPRAISRAIRRLESAKRATQRLSRVSIRGGCGCK